MGVNPSQAKTLPALCSKNENNPRFILHFALFFVSLQSSTGMYLTSRIRNNKLLTK